jgi:DNA segregation ATPase FtsK/SpoIIIE-like protein
MTDMSQQYIYWEEAHKETRKYKDKYSLPINFGKDKNGNWIIKDLSNIENILISGATGTGKSNFLDSVICSLAETYSSEDLKLVLIDCKLTHFNYIKLPHLLYPLTGDVDEALSILKSCLEEIKRRKKNIIKEPKIVIVIDEFSDIMLSEEEAEEVIYQIARQGAQVGVHILLSSSRSIPKVFTPKIKTVINTRLAGAMATDKESMNLLDERGAEALEGNGDMIYKNKSGSIRVQTPFITYDEQIKVLNSFNQSKNKFYPPIDKDGDLYKETLELIKEEEKVFPHLLSERLNIDYYRAIQLLEMVVDENDKREDLYEEALKLYEEDKDINAIGISKNLKIHYERAKELMEKIKKKKLKN